MRKFLKIHLALLLLLPVIHGHTALKIGDSENKAILEGGIIKGILYKGRHKILIFDKGEVTLTDGKVSEIRFKKEENEAERLDSIVPDPAVNAAVRVALSKPGGKLAKEDLYDLRKLEVSPSTKGTLNAHELTGLEHAINLFELKLSNNSITNWSSVTNMNSLYKLYFHGGTGKLSDYSPVDNLAPLADLSSLRSLYLSRHSLKSLAGIAGLTNLYELVAPGNQISDLSALSTHTNNLKRLILSDNAISDIRALSGLGRLDTLWVDGNAVGSLVPLGGCVNLKSLNAANNGLSAISGIRTLSGLSDLNLNGNQLSSLNDFEGMASLTTLRVSGNRIRDISAVTRIPNLRALDISENELDISPGSENAKLIQSLIRRGVQVRFQPQAASAQPAASPANPEPAANASTVQPQGTQ